MKKKIIGIIIVVLCFVGIAGYQIKSKQNEEKKKLMQIEKRKQISSAIWSCLKNPKEMILYSIDPNLEDEDLKLLPKDILFHNFKILGSTKINNVDDQKIIAAEIDNAVAVIDKDFANCFWPRHGVRVTDGNIVYDFVICYHCNTLYLYEGDNKLKEIILGGTVDILNAILIKANVPLPKSEN